MTGMMESLQTINSFARTLLAVVIVGAGSLAGWKGYTTYYSKELESTEAAKKLASAQEELTRTRNELEERAAQVERQTRELAEKDASIRSLEADVAKKAEEIARLDTAMRLLKVDHRLAQLTVVDQSRDPDSKTVVTEVEFVEVNDEGFSIDEPRRFQIRGELVYIDNWVVKFEDKYIEEQNDLDRTTSLVLFRRIFGDQQEPRDGMALDDTNRPPRAYTRGGAVSEFERRIWSDFWNIANDEKRAHELGIRAAHGEAVSIKAEKGRSYRLMLRASDGLSLVPNERATN